MCQHHDPGSDANARHGSSLAHGHAHTCDHRFWTRRDFLLRMTAAAAGATFVAGGLPVHAFGRSPLLDALRSVETSRVLVLIQLSGGNDGLNTVIPVEDDRYYQARPSLAIPRSEALVLPDQQLMALHPELGALLPLYADGHVAVLQNVGYTDPVLSHFRSTDIWLSASDAGETVTTGWAGRYLDDAYPDFETDPPSYPLAVQIGGGSSSLFKGPATNMGMSIANTNVFDRIADRGLLYETDDLPATTYGDEMAFVRSVANSSFRYAGVIQETVAGVADGSGYPAGNPLAQNLQVVAKLIKGRLGARIYLVSLGSFDTHAGQLDRQALLLRYLAEGLKAFYDDLATAGMDEEALVMTFSEFGRRVQQNASNGTDHGTAAPLFLFGGGLNGGLFGDAPDLGDLDTTGNLKHSIDFRSVYATTLQDWFGLPAASVDAVLGGTFDRLDFVAEPTSTGTQPAPELPAAFALQQNYPNPFNPSTVIAYRLSEPSHVALAVFDTRGRRVRTLVDAHVAAGSHEVTFDATGLASGTYYYRLTTPHGQRTRPMVVVR